METPSSMRRVTRSQTSLENPAALVDITNSSPIVGLAAGSLKRLPPKTPGSGEAILRGQVKTLLQKVEEEEVEVVKPSSEQWGAPFLALLGHLRSPASLLAPTPANTPQIICQGGGESQEEEETLDVADSLINRALLFDSPEEDDRSSAWGDEEEGEEDGDAGLLDDLCEGLRTMSMGQRELPRFTGKHTRFAYNSDDEIVGEEEECLLLKGLPAPKGKHLRFQEGEEEED
ncbi:unnamed protein product [Spirodela intermedia]|uniref:Uncharacterized protein n=1 Tax=Spirodela intermedia TaxID=51605 RepID=A0A7I8IZ00_SPIIN|nr:unnamed protein product [Spirodela intermedia]CAA6663215.1 unnamed protein product [Spirodela intermedia]